jgi:hypothetical protein
MGVLRALQRLGRRIALTYHHICAREDRLALGITLPAGVWACHACRWMGFEQSAHVFHVAMSH